MCWFLTSKMLGLDLKKQTRSAGTVQKRIEILMERLAHGLEKNGSLTNGGTVPIWKQVCLYTMNMDWGLQKSGEINSKICKCIFEKKSSVAQKKRDGMIFP